MPSPPRLSPLSPRHRNVPLQDTSIPRVSSPLNPAAAAPPELVAPAFSSSSSDDDDDLPQIQLAFRGQSDTGALSPSITIGNYAGGSESGSSLSLPSDLTLVSRGRTASPNKLRPREPSPAPSGTLDASWWGEHERGHLPWKETSKRRVSIPAGQLQGLEHTKTRVALAVRSVLGNVADVGFELLAVTSDLLVLAPVPGLALAAKTLLGIWNAAQNVDVNFYGCLRLTERCADILISIRQEVDEAGGHVGQGLAAPVTKLEDTFYGVLLFMQKQVRRPFLKRYLKRDEIQHDLNDCDAGLRDALSLFGLSVQIRILKQVQATETQRRDETQALVNALVAGGVIKASDVHPPQSPLQLTMGEEQQDTPRDLSETLEHNRSSETITRFITTSNALGLVDEPAAGTAHPDVLSTLAALQQCQNSIDTTRDLTEIRQLMRRVIQAGTDSEILEILQVKDDQMPEAIKSLQRVLEKVSEKPGLMEEPSPPPGVVIGTVKRSVSVKDTEKKGIQRSRTTVSLESSINEGSTSGSGSASSASRKRDTLNQEFMETGISALMRMSRGRDTNLPSWTITKYEVNREKQIGVGGFSKVYRGTWNGRKVAIKVLKMKVTKQLFIREVEIWKKLHHPNIVELFGASSATQPPWFFVSPYMKHGNLVDYLRKIEGDLQKAQMSRSASPTRIHKSGRERNSTVPLPGFKLKSDVPVRESTLPVPIRSTPDGKFEVHRQWDLFRFMLGIAQGMRYLHSKNILHGDLKASNVLVDDDYRCVITDFGQSEIRSEAYRLSGESLPHKGTMRWQAPEILNGDLGEVDMTRETDVYAFSIACVEIVNLGKLPWGIMLEDEVIRQRVLKDNARPNLNESPFNTPSLQEILKLCWHRDPAHRPHFVKIVRDFELLQKNFGHGFESPKRALKILSEENIPNSPSPDMRPHPLPPLSPTDTEPLTEVPQRGRQHHEETVATSKIKTPEPVMFTSTKETRSSPWRDEDDDWLIEIDNSDSESMAPNDRVLEMKSELRYRLLLTHSFHPSLIMPLWQPSQVKVGAVGYLNRPRGDFITLFNAFSPQKSEHPQVQGLPSIHGYGKVTQSSQKHDRHIIQKGIDSVAGWLSRNKSDVPIRRRYTLELHSGHKAAYLCTESTEYRYMEDLVAPRKWFQRNIDTIIHTFGREHHVQREDIVLVVGLLQTPSYGLFVSHRHPDGHVHFNVYASPKTGQPWGMFTTDNEAFREPGPLYEEASDSSRLSRLEASKVSNLGGDWDTVLVARLRFKPDSEEPTTK